MCRPPRHETHALPLERRRRRTSSCSNVHLVSVDTPTLSASNGPRKKGTSVRRLCRRKGISSPTKGSALLHLVDGLRGDNRVRLRNPFFPFPPALRLSCRRHSFGLLDFDSSCSLSFLRARLRVASLCDVVVDHSRLDVSLRSDRY